MEILGFILEQSEVFSWIDPDTKALLHFDVAGMRAFAESGGSGTEGVRFPIDDEMAKLFLKDRNVDMAYVRETIIGLNQRFEATGTLDVENEKAFKPAIGILMADGRTLTVDGHHRIVLWTALKLSEGRMWLFTEETAKAFMLDLPPTVTERLRRELS